MCGSPVAKAIVKRKVSSVRRPRQPSAPVSPSGDKSLSVGAKASASVHSASALVSTYTDFAPCSDRHSLPLSISLLCLVYQTVVVFS